MLEALASSFRDAGLGVSADDLRDILWLAEVCGPAPARSAVALLGSTRPHLEGSAIGNAPAPLAPAPTTANAPATLQPSSRSEPELFAAAQHGLISAGVLRVPGVTATPSPADLRRALQPLARRVPSLTRWQLDEEATATHKADTGIWRLFHQPVRERWFDLNVVVEHSASMALWQPDVEAFVRGLKGQGGFRSLTRYVLDGPGPGLLRTRNRQRALPLAALHPPGLRPLTLVLTDTGSEHWRSGAAQRWLFAAGKVTSVSVVQLLPQRSWQHTALGEPDVVAWADRAGLPNAMLHAIADDELDGADPDRCLVPLLGLSPAAIRRWAHATAARVAVTVPCAAVARLAGPAPKRSTGLTPPERVAAYRRKVSRAAYELAVFLTVPDPLTVPVMRLVQRTMLPDTGTAELAEFFLGGLLRPVGNDGGAGEGVYRYHEGVRNELMRGLRYSEHDVVAEQLTRVGRALEQAQASSAASGFDAYFPHPSGNSRLSDWALPFATSSRDIMDAMEKVATPPAVSAPPASAPDSRFLDGRAITRYVLDSGRLAEADEPLDRLLILATETQQTWVVFTRQAVVLVLDDERTRSDMRLVQRLVPLAEALPVEAHVDRAGIATVSFGPKGAPWYYSRVLFASPSLLEEAVTERIRTAMATARGAFATIDRLKATTALIRDPNGGWGAGCLLAPRRIGTSAAVVAGWAQGQWHHVILGTGASRRSCRARVLRADEVLGMAILEVDGADEVAPLTAGPVPPTKTGWVGLGFPSSDGAQPLVLEGYVQASTVESGRDPASLLLHSDKFAENVTSMLAGFAGGPVLVDGALVGLMTDQVLPEGPRGKKAHYVYARPTAAVMALLEEPIGASHSPEGAREEGTLFPLDYSSADSERIYISCVADEFEKAGVPFSGLRRQLRAYLDRARGLVWLPEAFPQTAVDTVTKLADEICLCAVVIHLVGEQLGAVADPAAVAAYLKAEPEFLANHPELRAALGDFSGLSYTQWEAFIALHHGTPLLVYATDKASAQQTHLDRLVLGRRYATRIEGDTDLLGQLIGDLRVILPDVPPFTRKVSGTQLAKHAPKVLFGRETELEALDAAWASEAQNVFTQLAGGGAGKTSLVFHWVQTRFAAKGWPGIERYFDWSFYSQGAGESRQTSADLFIAKALEFFGDPDPTHGGAHERGARLAWLIRQHRTLLVLDGIEPLQYPPGDPQVGRLKDPALEALLRELAADNPGLVVITTREHLTNIEAYATTEEQKLDKLSPEGGVSLLRHLQIVGTDEELLAAWRDVGGHALTLNLLGRFIADAFDDRDIRHYREVKFEAADREHQGRSAFRVMIAYERWLHSGGPERQRELSVLRLTGLFDRPMANACLQALRAEPAIAGLTDALVELTPQQWNIAVKRLSEVELLFVSPDAIDAHPLIREYFAAQLKREQPEAFQVAHSRLFDFLCENTPHRPDGIAGLTPLYEAVTHGCLAGRHQEACDKVYVDRILRGTGNDGYYSTRKLGEIAADLGAVAAFFDEPWNQVSQNLIEADRAWLLAVVAFNLRALGRLDEALQPMRVSGEMAVRAAEWKEAALIYSNLSELEVMLGRLPDAVADARQATSHADRSGDASRRMATRTAAAHVSHQSGHRAEAGTLFAEAERMQQERQPQFDLLYSIQGFRYCDWLMAPAEQAAWQRWLDQPLSNSISQLSDGLVEVERRATITSKWMIDSDMGLLSIALGELTLARVGLIRAMLEADPTNPQPTPDLPHVAAAVNGLRAAGQMDDLPRGLLTAALYHCVRGEPDLAQKHLAEAQQIAERGPMPLFLADIHLTRARLFHDHAALEQAANLIRTLGYGRRSEELAAAEKAFAQMAD
jgi:Trypsin-like peptidase domain